MGHLLIAAPGDTAGIRNFFQLIFSGSQLLQGGGQSDFFDERRQGVDAVSASSSSDAPSRAMPQTFSANRTNLDNPSL